MAHQYLGGQCFGRWAVGETPTVRHGRTYWPCVCDCGIAREVAAHTLLAGKSQSCGCLAYISSKNRKIVHGLTNTPIFRVWKSIKTRCYNPNYKLYQNYGGRGIKLCQRWHDVALFAADMGERPSVQHTVERIDNDGDYEPSNCRWATRAEQMTNRTTSVIVDTIEGKLTMAEAARRAGITFGAMRARVNNGWAKAKLLLPRTV